ncbi:MAG: DUF6572 domain-containing protein [Draconibacterium sp.]
MSLSEVKQVDAIGEDKESGMIIVTLIDEMKWDNENNHLTLLQEKINNYLSFIESGEMQTEYPNSINKKVSINVVMQYEPSNNGFEFLEKVKEIILNAGIGFQYGVYTG